MLSPRIRLLVAIAFTLLGLALSASAQQDTAPIRKAVEDYLRIQTKGMPGKVSYSVGTIASVSQLPPCASFAVRQENGARLWGRTMLTVQCQAGARWSIFVPVQIRVEGDYLVASRNLAPGQMLTEQDLEIRQGDLTEMPGNLLNEPRQALGRVLGVTLAAGQPVRIDALRQPLVIQQGQRVTVSTRGAGFQVATEGQALNAATEGQVVKVRLPNGQVVNGLARSGGLVEISY